MNKAAIAGAIFTNRLNFLNSYLAGRGITGDQLKIHSFAGALHATYVTAAILALIAMGTLGQ